MRIVGLVLFLLGVVSGYAYSRAPERAVVVRAGYRVLAADFHVHTALSDGGLSPLAIAAHARRRGLDVVAVTEHNGILSAAIAKLAARFVGEGAPLVIMGEEITTHRAHLIAVGLSQGIAPTTNPRDAVRSVHEQGGVVIAAHPVKRYWPALLPVRDELDGAEVAHPFANPSARASRGGWRSEDLAAFYEHEGRRLAAIGSSDYHWGAGMGSVRTWVFATEASERAVIDAIRAGRTVVRTASGELVGEPALVEALEREPMPEVGVDRGYAGVGWADRVFRALGWLGVVLLVFSRRR